MTEKENFRKEIEEYFNSKYAFEQTIENFYTINSKFLNAYEFFASVFYVLFAIITIIGKTFLYISFPISLPIIMSYYYFIVRKSYIKDSLEKYDGNDERNPGNY